MKTELPKLKSKLTPKTTGMKILNLSIKSVYFDQIRRGTKKEEYRKYNDYYIERCTYEEDGRRYLVPFDALVLYQGKRAMTVSLKDITCDGKHFVFHLGEILYPKNGS